MTDYALTICNVSCRFPRAPQRGGLSDISLALVPGEITGIAGPGGAGKSTLLQIAAGCLRPPRGEARVCGVRATDPAARALVGYAREAAAYPPSLTVGEVLMYYARLHADGGDEPAARRLVREAFDSAGLGAAADLHISALCRADLRRLALAQATLGRRQVLVLDETLSDLDAVTRRDLRGRIAALAADGVAVLIASRDPGVLERLAARVLILREGRIVRAGPVPTLVGERVLEVILDAPPREAPPGFRITESGIEASLSGRTVEAALALCRAHRLPVRASRVRVKSLEDVVLETHDTH
ncbi:MAG TPA: ABC transporter ATP-binding protein [Gemmatimonadales bacterium]|nr:ABC transporter ATP-binding protein [Gemmatimonadales bacterium]